MAELMSKRDFLVSVKNGIINDNVKAKATADLNALDEANKKKAEASAKKKAEVNAPRMKQITDYLSKCTVPQLITDVATKTGLSVPTVSGLATVMEKEGKVVKGVRSVTGKGKQTTLALPKAEVKAEADTEAEVEAE